MSQSEETGRAGQAPPIVLVHAGVCDNRMWDALEALLDSGADVHRHEMRGFGQTPPSSGPFSHADDLEAALQRAGPPAVLVGASFGGLVALETAARRPELVRALVLLDAALPDHEWSQEMIDYDSEEQRMLETGDIEGAVQLNLDFWLAGAEPAVREEVAAMTRRAMELQSEGGGEADGAEEESEEAEESIDLAAITAPALVVVGERDREDFKRIAERLAAELPDARSAIIEGAAHLPAVERPQVTAGLLNRFLREL